MLRVDLVPGEAVAGLVPNFQGTDSLLLATGILGATVMPHVIYLHSALTQNRIPAGRRRRDRRFLFRHQQVDVFLAMGLAGVINLSMLLISAALFFGTDVPDTDTLAGRARRAGPGARPARGVPVRPGPARLRASRPPASAPTPARWSCRASSGAASR